MLVAQRIHHFTIYSRFIMSKNASIALFSPFFILFCAVQLFSQASAIPAERQISPEGLVKILQGKDKPLLFQVGSHTMYAQAHISGSEYLGSASTETGLQQLRKRVESLPKSKSIVLYCGCCPWSRCPNVKPADDALHALGFTNVKVLYIANNFGTDWVDKGYPVEKGE
jgi:rhodanese-related sulfurtransferase